MSAFASLAARKPPSFVLVPPDAFKDEWEDRPREKVAIGLRLVSHQDLQVARAQGRRRANEAFPNLDDEDGRELIFWSDAFNDALIAQIISAAICDPNDVHEMWEPFKAAPEDMCRMFLTSDGLRLLYDAWERMRISVDPTQREATNEEAALLPALLAERGEGLGRVRAMRARRLLAFVLDELESVEGPTRATPQIAAP